MIMTRENRDTRWSVALLITAIAAAALFQHNLAALDPAKSVQRYLLDIWGVERGLPSDIINTVTQSASGFLWLGTAKGLVRFDGITFESIYIPGKDADGRPSAVNALEAVDDGGLWIGTASGLFHLKGLSLSRFKKEDGMPEFFITRLFLDSFGNLWIGTLSNHLYCRKNASNEFFHFGPEQGVNSPYVSMILEDRNGTLWVANHSGGLLQKSGDGFVKHPLEIDHSIYYVYNVCIDRQGMWWIGTNTGLYGFSGFGTAREKAAAYFSPHNGLSDDNIWSTTEDVHANLWVATERGLNRINKNNRGEWRVQQLLPDTIVLEVFEDREKSLWLSTNGTGLQSMRDGTFYNYGKSSGVPNWYVSLHQDSRGVIRIGSTLGELFRFSGGRFVRELETDNNIESAIFAIEEYAPGDLWLGTVQRGIMRYKNGVVTRYTNRNGLVSNWIRTLFKDSRGDLWIGTRGGLNRFRHGVFDSFTILDGLVGNNIQVLQEDRSGNIWVGTTKGISVFPAESGDPLQLSTHLDDLHIHDIYQDPQGVIWVGTSGNGLKRYKQAQWHSYSTNDGLETDSILSVSEDRGGNLWFGSAGGVYRVVKQELDDRAAGKIARVNSHVFGLSDGLESLDCRDGARNAAIKTRQGELWFSTHKGIAVVDPVNVSINKFPPTVVIEQVHFNYEYISQDQNGAAFTGIKDLRFQFTAPTFVSPRRVKIKYMLEGHDTGWRNVVGIHDRQAHYRKIPPGSYRFRVIAANGSGVWNSKGASFSFTLTPYFYQTLWFELLVLVLLLSGAAALYFLVRKQVYLRKLKQKYKNSTLDPEKAEKYLKKLLHLLEEERLYRQENITLVSLAKELNIPPRYLSQIVNERINKNFRDLINRYRIEEAKTLLISPPRNKDYSILEIAFEVGFNSKEVFNRSFKKYTGMTPTQFKRKTVHRPGT